MIIQAILALCRANLTSQMVRQSGEGGGAMILAKYDVIEEACPVALRCTSCAGRSDKQKIESKNRGSAVQLREKSSAI